MIKIDTVKAIHYESTGTPSIILDYFAKNPKINKMLNRNLVDFIENNAVQIELDNFTEKYDMRLILACRDNPDTIYRVRSYDLTTEYVGLNKTTGAICYFRICEYDRDQDFCLTKENEREFIAKVDRMLKETSESLYPRKGY